MRGERRLFSRELKSSYLYADAGQPTEREAAEAGLMLNCLSLWMVRARVIFVFFLCFSLVFQII